MPFWRGGKGNAAAARDAGREPAGVIDGVASTERVFDHDVSILIAIGNGRCLGWHQEPNSSMTII